MSIDKLFYPKAVAVCGSVSAGKLGAVLIERLIAGNFKKVYAINPKGKGYMETEGYCSFKDAPADIDMAVIAAPASAVCGILDDAGNAGVRAAVIISSGFSEAGYAELEQEVIAVCKKHGIRFIGPNCAGMVNTSCCLLATLEAAPSPGRISIISQSGAIGGMLMAASAAGSLGIGKFVSYGNGADLNATELLKYLVDDNDTSAIAMYLENINDGRSFMEALSYATSKKPVLIIKSGRSEGGKRAAMSHTGSMAGADAVYDAAFSKCGAVRVESLEEMLDVCGAIDSVKQLEGRRVAIVTNSGGPGVLTTDRCEKVGLLTPPPSEALRAKLKELLPPHAGLANPFDITVEGTAEQYGKVIEAVLLEYDAAIVIDIGTPYLKALPVATSVADAAKKCGKPVLADFRVGVDIDAAVCHLNENGVPVLPSSERAADVLANMAKFNKASGKICFDFEEKHIDKDFLLEYESMRLFSDAGICMPRAVFAKTADEAVLAAEQIGYPVCVKIVSPKIIHKSDVGGVKLNIRDEKGVRDAFDALYEIGREKDFCGVIVVEMLNKGVEVIMGMTRDPQFGPVVAFGLGGIYTEALKDIAIRVAPLSKAEALDIISSVKAYKLLKGVRGEAPCDIEALAEMLVKLSELPFVYPDISEIDLNPVFAHKTGAVAADARIILKK